MEIVPQKYHVQHSCAFFSNLIDSSCLNITGLPTAPDVPELILVSLKMHFCDYFRISKVVNLRIDSCAWEKLKF